ncbi:MAG: 2-oxo acid dehydrogenase subunit E2 [Ilumatobacteraceae bacterium]|nr:2-oxo acid dehydrogenase subunit E2 [Ilumatobacteraceae bacterium]
MAEVTLPQLGETVTEGTITRWFKKVGDTVAADEPLFEVSTDKVDTEVPSPIAGVLTEIRVPEGETVPVGAVIGVVGVASGAAPVVAAPAAPVVAAPVAPVVVAPVVATSLAPVAVAPVAPVAVAPVHDNALATLKDNRLLSPVVRRLVTEHNLNVDGLIGTGPGGRITREDVLDHIDKLAVASSAPTSQPTVTATATTSAPISSQAAVNPPVVRVGQRDEVVALSKIRQITGAHMLMSQAVSPHALSMVEVDYSNVDATRLRLKDEFKEAEGFSLTYLPFISRAVVDAIGDFPHMNASISGTDLIVHRYVDLGVAVDVNGQGLLVPVVRSAEGKRLRAIAREIRDLAVRAKTRKITPDEIQGGTFTISNNGSAGSVLTMPIINQPQLAILSTDAIVRKPVVVNSDGGESIAIHPVGNLAMSWDHRAFDGAYAAGFLSRIKEILETRDWSSEF